MQRSKVSIIVLNYNGLSFLKKCVDSIQKQSYSSIEIVLADNNSTDGSVEHAEKQKRIVVVKNKENYGYVKANNIAAKIATGKFLFFLNNDTELFPDTIEKLVNNFQEKAILTAHQIPPWKKEDVGSSGAGMDIFGYPYVIDDIKKMKVFYADGAMFFIKKSDFIDMGMFDEELFIFQEDIDLSWRAQIHGYTIKSCWDAHLYHFSGGTVLGGGAGKNKAPIYTSSYIRRYLNEKNILRNILKNYSFPLCVGILLLLVCLHIVEIIGLLFLLQAKAAQCYIKAYWWNITHLGNTLHLRKKIQASRVVSDWALMKRMYWSYSKVNALLKLGIPAFK